MKMKKMTGRNSDMTGNQKIILLIFIGYLLANAVFGIVGGRKQSASTGMSEE